MARSTMVDVMSVLGDERDGSPASLIPEVAEEHDHLVQPCSPGIRRLAPCRPAGCAAVCALVRIGAVGKGWHRWLRPSCRTTRAAPIAAAIREELARRRISRQFLADEARISISTLEKALSGRRAFTLATTIRLEEALGIRLRRVPARPGRGSRPSPGWARPRRSRLLFAPLGHLDRRQLPDAPSLLRRPLRDLRLPHADRAGTTRPRRCPSASPSASTLPLRSTAPSRCPTSPATSISSPTATGNTG